MSESDCEMAEQRAVGRVSGSGGDAPLIRVLMVEDDAAFARIAASILLRAKDAGHEVSLASTLREAETLLATTRPDVVLLDLTLPDSSGMNTVERVLACAGDVPVVVLSGIESETMALAAIRAGAKDYIVKGGDPRAIVQAVRRAVERSEGERRLLEAEEQLRAARLQLVQADGAESAGLPDATTAHELKTALAVLHMGIENIERRYGQDAGMAATLKLMMDAADRAMLAIQRLPTAGTRKGG